MGPNAAAAIKKEVAAAMPAGGDQEALIKMITERTMDAQRQRATAGGELDAEMGALSEDLHGGSSGQLVLGMAGTTMPADNMEHRLD